MCLPLKNGMSLVQQKNNLERRLLSKGILPVKESKFCEIDAFKPVRF